MHQDQAIMQKALISREQGEKTFLIILKHCPTVPDNSIMQLNHDFDCKVNEQKIEIATQII
jgi:hypothetical protein